MIRVDQPRNGDLLGDPILIAGIGTGFEATINYRISEGHDQLEGYVMVGGGSGEHGQFQVAVSVADTAMKADRLFVEVYEASAKDGSDLHKVTRTVLYGPRLIDGYYGWREHRVKAGQTLTAIAREHYGTPDFLPIARANQLEDPDLILPGEVLRIPVGA